MHYCQFSSVSLCNVGKNLPVYISPIALCSDINNYDIVVGRLEGSNHNVYNYDLEDSSTAHRTIAWKRHVYNATG